MAVRWRYRLELGDLFQAEDRPFEEVRDEVADRIERAPFYEKTELGWLVADLRDAEDGDEFDRRFDEFYDYADERRIWVETITTREEREE